MRLASDPIKRVTLELGGKSPNLVFADADLDERDPELGLVDLLRGRPELRGALAGARRAARSTTTSSRRSPTLAGATQGRRPARSRDAGRLADLDGASRPGPRLRRARDARRAPRSSPAARSPDGKGAFYPPTVLAGVDNAMTVAQEEIFGPVVTVIPFEDEKDAIRIANDVRYGLMATVWTGDPARGHRVARADQGRDGRDQHAVHGVSRASRSAATSSPASGASSASRRSTSTSRRRASSSRRARGRSTRSGCSRRHATGGRCSPRARSRRRASRLSPSGSPSSPRRCARSSTSRSGRSARCCPPPGWERFSRCCPGVWPPIASASGSCWRSVSSGRAGFSSGPHMPASFEVLFALLVLDRGVGSERQLGERAGGDALVRAERAWARSRDQADGDPARRD